MKVKKAVSGGGPVVPLQMEHSGQEARVFTQLMQGATLDLMEASACLRPLADHCIPMSSEDLPL